MTATQIAEELGGVSRNAVIGKAHRLGLEARPFEPIAVVKGASVPGADLVRYRWRNGPRYLHADCNRVLHAACAIAASRTKAATPHVSAHELIDGLVALTRYAGPSSNSGRFGQHIAEVDISPASDALDVVDKLAVPPHDKAIERSVLRWDVVEIFESAARIRARTGEPTAPIDLRHLICGLITTPAGHLGFSDAGLWSAGFPRLQSLALAIINDRKIGPSDAGSPEWRRIEDEIRSQPPLGVQAQPRADYTSDQVVAGRDALGASVDAQALANLILLEAAEPPLAIAVFGAWGSGKSTLLSELRHEVRRQSEEERDRIAAGGERLADQPARVSGIMQVDFNAWTFSDSENLWASLTAELFDQITAGGHDQNVAQHGAQLVKEVADRTRVESEAHRQAEAQLRASDEKIAIAETTLARISERRSSAFIDASAQALLELFGPLKKDNAETSGKDDDSVNEPLAPFRKVVLADAQMAPAVKVRAYVEASGPVARFLLLLRDYLRKGAGFRHWLLFAGGALLTVLTVAWLQGRLPFTSPSWPVWARWLAASLPIVASISALVLPAIRATAVLGKVIAETKDRLQKENAAAQVKLEEGLKEHRDAAKALDSASQFLDRYRDIAELASPPPALMLEYLLKDSADIASIKGKLGVLGTVRRCFDQLNAVIAQSRALDPNSPVQRIIIYIDDLDRCSERQVVQVLEAIHLLLAYPCFVVIAAVDASWLQHALLAEHRGLAEGSDMATPADYLEKIFQIPFWVRPIDSSSSTVGGYRAYVDQLLGQGERAAATGGVGEAADNSSADGLSQQTLRRVPPLRPETRSVGLPQRLKLTDQEQQFLLELGPLAAKSPRAVKRMINLYRLIRVSIVEWDDQRALLGKIAGIPSFYTVQLLLACEVGLPVPLMSALAAALDTMSDSDWLAFTTGATSGRDLTGPFAIALGSSTYLERFSQAVDAMVRRADETPSIDDLRLALAHISKFSFRSKR